jgi:hypothetical protein
MHEHEATATAAVTAGSSTVLMVVQSSAQQSVLQVAMALLALLLAVSNKATAAFSLYRYSQPELHASNQ